MSSREKSIAQSATARKANGAEGADPRRCELPARDQIHREYNPEDAEQDERQATDRGHGRADQLEDHGLDVEEETGIVAYVLPARPNGWNGKVEQLTGLML